MIIDLIKRSLFGIAIGSLVYFTILTFLVINSIESTTVDMWRHLLASMLVGIYFSLAALIFESEKGSLLKQTIIHFTLTVIIVIPIFIFAGWIPFQANFVLIGAGIFMANYLLNWLIFYLHFKRVERSMNDSISQK